MAGLPPAPRPTVTAFEAAVGRVESAAILADADKAEMQARTRELIEHVRTDIENRAYILRVLLRIDVALHALRALPPADPRIVALQEARRELEVRAGGTMRDRARSSVSGYLDAARDTWNTGVKPMWEGRPTETGRAATSAALVAGGLALGTTAITGTLSALTEGSGVQKPTIGQRIKGFFGKLLVPVVAALGFLGLGRFAAVRAATQRTPELREERTYLLDRTLTVSPPVRGMTFRRTGPEVLVEKDGSQYRMVFENAPGMPPPASGEETLGAMIDRLYASGSVGSGLGIERGGLPGGSIGGIRTGEFFTLTEAGIDNIRTALGTPEALTPAGAVADVPLRFNLQSMTPTQMAFVRRCIARGAVIGTTDDGVMTVTTKVRLKRTVAGAPVAPVLATLDAACNLGSLAPGTYAYGVTPGSRVEFGAPAVAINAGMTHVLAPGVQMKRTSDTRLEVEILPTAAGGTAYTFRVGANNITFATEAPAATAADTIALLNAAGERPRVLAGELASFADAGLATHAGSPDTFAAFTNKLTQLNNLIPAAHRADAGVRAAVDALLTVGAPTKLGDKRYVTAGGTYKIISRNGQLACEMLPLAPPPPALDTLVLRTARNNLAIGSEYRIAIPGTARRAIVSTRALAGNALVVDNTVDSFISKPVAWTTYSAVDGPVDLRTVEDGGTTYLILKTRRACTFRVRFDDAPPAAGTISADYQVIP